MQSGRSDTMPGGDSRAALLAVALVVAVGAAAALALALSGAAAADDAVAEGEVSLHGDAATSGTSWSYHIEDLDAVEDLDIEIEGREATEPRSSSTTAETASWDIDIGGTTEPEDAVMRLEGLDSGETETRSGALSPGESDTITVEGDDPPTDSELTIEGEYSESGGSESGSVSGSSTESFDVDGSLDPEGESISFDADSPEFLYSSDSSHATSEELSEDSILNTRHTPSESFGVVEFGGSWAEYENPSGWGDVEIKDDTEVIETGTVEFGEDEEFRLIADSEIDVEEVDWDVELRIKAIESTWESDASLSIANTDSTDVTYRYYEPMATEVTVDGETYGVDETRSLDLNTGSNSVDISPNAGAVSYSASWTERDGVVDPSVSVDGNTVSESGEFGGSTTESIDLSTGSHSIDASYDGEGLAYEIEWTERTYPENPSIELAGETIAEAGTLEPGETVEEAVSLPLGESTVDVASDGPVEASVEWTEVSQTKDAEIIVNGHSASNDGVLDDGETMSLDVSDDWVEAGDNSVGVSLADGNGGPEPQVDISYQHVARTELDTTRSSTTWEEEVDSSRVFATEQHDVVLSYPMPEHVVEVDQVVIDGETAASEDYQLDGTDLEVSVGSVEAQEQIDVFARGSKVRVKDGDIDVVDPTSEGDVLDSTIEVTEASEDLRVDVGETVRSERLHRASETSWGERLPVRVESDGSQTLLLGASGATEGSSATITESEWSLEAESGDIVATALAGEMPERGAEVNGSLARVDIDSGEIGGSQATLTRHDAQTGESYQLVDVIDDRVVERSTAGSPVSFDIVDEPAEYRIELAPESGDIIGVGGAGDDGGDGLLPPWLLLILGVSASVSFLGLGSERGYLPRSALVIGSGGVVVLGLELVSPVSLLAELRWSATSATNRIIAMLADTGIAIVLGASAVVLAVWWFDGRTSRSIPLPIYLGIGGLAAFSVVESISPGAITEGRLPGMQEVGPLIWILLIGGSIALVWRSIGSDEPTVEISTED